jgi:hypothetical protein
LRISLPFEALLALSLSLEVTHLPIGGSLLDLAFVFNQTLEVAHLVEALHCLGLLACCVVVIFP